MGIYSETMIRETWLNKVEPHETPLPLPKRGDTALVGRLPPEEYEVYIWLLRAYSIDWIAESLGLEKKKVKTLAANIYTTLEVGNQRELVRYYFSPGKYAAPAGGKPALPGEELAYSMARYTDQCVEAYSLKKTR